MTTIIFGQENNGLHLCALSGNFDPVWLSRCCEVMRGRGKALGELRRTCKRGPFVVTATNIICQVDRSCGSPSEPVVS